MREFRMQRDASNLGLGILDQVTHASSLAQFSEYIKQDATIRKRYLRKVMMHSLLQSENAQTTSCASFPSPAYLANKPMKMTMRYKNPSLKNTTPSQRETFTRAIKPAVFMDMIQEHKWIESQKRGHDIGLETAMQDWVSRFGSKLRVRIPLGSIHA